MDTTDPIRFDALSDVNHIIAALNAVHVYLQLAIKRG